MQANVELRAKYEEQVEADIALVNIIGPQDEHQPTRIGFDPNELMILIQRFASPELEESFVDFSDINIKIDYLFCDPIKAGEEALPRTYTHGSQDFEKQRKSGNRIFDIVQFLNQALTPENRAKCNVTLHENTAAEDIISIAEYRIALSAFVLCYLITGETQDEHMELKNTYLKSIFKEKDSQHGFNGLKDRLASFDLAKLGYQFLRYLPIARLKKKHINRISLGLPGHRLLTALFAVRPKGGAVEGDYQLAMSIRQVLKYQYGNHSYWNLFTPTRHANVSSYYGAMNPGLLGLIYAIGDEAEIERQKKYKFIHQGTVIDNAKDQWKLWFSIESGRVPTPGDKIVTTEVEENIAGTWNNDVRYTHQEFNAILLLCRAQYANFSGNIIDHVLEN